MLCSGTDPESYITVHTLVYEDLLHDTDFGEPVSLEARVNVGSRVWGLGFLVF